VISWFVKQDQVRSIPSRLQGRGEMRQDDLLQPKIKAFSTEAKASLLFWPPERVEISCNGRLPLSPNEPRCFRISCVCTSTRWNIEWVIATQMSEHMETITWTPLLHKLERCKISTFWKWVHMMLIDHAHLSKTN
jgi:hypothetical protein